MARNGCFRSTESQVMKGLWFWPAARWVGVVSWGARSRRCRRIPATRSRVSEWKLCCVSDVMTWEGGEDTSLWRVYSRLLVRSSSARLDFSIVWVEMKRSATAHLNLTSACQSLAREWRHRIRTFSTGSGSFSSPWNWWVVACAWPCLLPGWGRELVYRSCDASRHPGARTLLFHAADWRRLASGATRAGNRSEKEINAWKSDARVPHTWSTIGANVGWVGTKVLWLLTAWVAATIKKINCCAR